MNLVHTSYESSYYTLHFDTSLIDVDLEKILCANYLTEFTIDLNGIWHTLETCWCDEPHSH